MRANNLGRNRVFLRSGYSEPSAEHGLIINGRQRRLRRILTRSLRAVGWLIRRKGVQWGAKQLDRAHATKLRLDVRTRVSGLPRHRRGDL